MASADVRAEIEALAKGLADLCGNISVREDENGPYVLAFGLKDIHSLELRRVGKKLHLELWHGATYDKERVTGLFKLKTPTQAIKRAREWLQNDAI